MLDSSVTESHFHLEIHRCMTFPARYTFTILLGIIGAIIAVFIFQNEQSAVAEQLLGFPESINSGHQIRPFLLSSLFFLPAIAGCIYCCGSILDRYVFKSFVTAFALALSGLGMIWILVDLQDNLSDFLRAESPVSAIAVYYSSQLPAISLILLPNTLLFSLLFILGKMSSSREIVGIIQTGRGVPRLIAPLLVFGILCGLVCGVFNYHWGPVAEGSKKIILAKLAGRKARSAQNVARFVPESRRFWAVHSFPADLSKDSTLEQVSVTALKDDGQIDYRVRAETAEWDADSSTWSFHNAIVLKNDFPAPRDLSRLSKPLIKKWKETPWQLIQPGLQAPDLGIPGINTWLQANENQEWIDRRPFITQWHYRWAQPFICLITVLLAAPLGIVFSRRGAAGGVAIAVALSLGMLLSTNVFLALGEAGYIPPLFAAWGTNVVFTIIALVLLQRRIVGRPIYQSFLRMLPGVARLDT